MSGLPLKSDGSVPIKQGSVVSGNILYCDSLGYFSWGAPPSGGGGSLNVLGEGGSEASIGSVTSINFAGAGVTVSGTSPNAIVTIPGGSAGSISGSGTNNRLTKWTSSSSIGDSPFQLDTTNSTVEMSNYVLNNTGITNSASLGLQSGNNIVLIPGGIIQHFGATTFGGFNLSGCGNITLNGSSNFINCSGGYVDNAERVYMPERGSDPPVNSGFGVLYTKNVGGVTRLFFRYQGQTGGTQIT